MNESDLDELFGFYGELLRACALYALKLEQEPLRSTNARQYLEFRAELMFPLLAKHWTESMRDEIDLGDYGYSRVDQYTISMRAPDGTFDRGTFRQMYRPGGASIETVLAFVSHVPWLFEKLGIRTLYGRQPIG